MAATDTTDATTQPAAGPYDLAQLQALAAQLVPQQPSAPPAPVNRSIISLLGEALGGGASDVAPADREAAGTRALLNFGANLSAASGPSVMPRNFGQILAQGVSGAEQSLGSSAAVSASRLAAQQQYQEKQQELHMEALKTAIPLLTLQTQMQQAAAARGMAGNQPAPAPGTSISGVGAPVVPRDPNAGTAGQQANNPGNVMVLPGKGLPAGATGAVPVTGGYVAAFPDVPTGVAAHSDTLNGYAASGTGTIRDAVTRWVGPGMAPKEVMDGYIADVAKAVGVDPDAKIDLSDPKVQRAFILAQQPHESGKPWLSPADVDKGLALAAARRAAPPAATGGTQAPAPYKVASTGPTAPPAPTAAPTATPAPGSVAAETAGLKVPPGATPPAAPGAQPAAPAVPTAAAPTTTTAPATPTAPSENPDIVSGDVVIKHPGSIQDFRAREMQTLPTTEDFNPDLTPAQKAAFTAKAAAIAQRAAGIDQTQKLLATLPFADQPKAAAEIVQQRAALAADRDNLAAEQQSTAQAKAQAAAAATTKFNTEQSAAVQTRYETALKNYTDAQGKVLGFNQDLTKADADELRKFNTKMIEPYVTAGAQANSILPNIALARQVIQGLPDRPVSQLSEDMQNKLALLEPYLPQGWKDTLKASDLTQQVLGGLVAKMGANIQSGQPGGRESAYSQFQTMLPKLQQTQDGRELALTFMEELARRQVAESTFLQKYQWDPKNIDPTRKVANMSGALDAMNAALPPMLKLPPVSYRPSASKADPNAAANDASYVNYYNSVRPGQRFIAYEPDESGQMHPIAKTKAPLVKGDDGKLHQPHPNTALD